MNRSTQKTTRVSLGVYSVRLAAAGRCAGANFKVAVKALPYGVENEGDGAVWAHH